jgi:nuclease S1
MANTKMTSAPTPGSAGERLLDEIFEKVARVRVPTGTSRLDLGLDLDASSGAPGVHMKLSLHADPRLEAPAATLALADGKPTEVVFGPKGHGAIVVIAMKDLEARRPDVKAQIDRILREDPVEGRNTYFAAANWPDRVKGDRPQTRPWHYVDILYDPRSPKVAPDLPDPPHALSQIAEMSEKLGREDDPEQKADALSFLLHLVGDVHQPFHCINRVTPDSPAPQGDRGGNSFKLSGPYRNLHSLWDDSVNLQLQDSAEELAVEIMQKYSRDSLARDLVANEPEAWVRAGYAIAVERGYKPLDGSNGEAAPRPSNAYLRHARDIGQRQAALGGYRLADLLTGLFGG